MGLLTLAFLFLFQPFVVLPAPQPDITVEIPKEPPLPIPETKDIIGPATIVSWEDIKISKFYQSKYQEIISPLTIVYDDSDESKMLLKELNRDWSSYDKSLEKIDELRDNLPVREINLVHYTDFKGLQKHKIHNEVRDYPAYRFSSAGDIKSIPRTAFSCTTWPLYTIQALAYQNCNLVEIWVLKAARIEILHKSLFDKYNKQFLLFNSLDFNEYTTHICTRCDELIGECECDQYYGSWRKDIVVEKLKNNPRYYPPIAKYPTKPETRMPWEYVNE